MQNPEICRKIRTLLYRAELNVLVCEKIQLHLGEKFPYAPAEYFLVLCNNNAFNEAVSILDSLLGQNKTEVNLNKLGVQIPELPDIRDDFSKNFADIRNKLISHKDKSPQHDGSEHVWQLVHPNLIKKVSNIIQRLNTLVLMYFDTKYDPINPFVLTLSGLHEIIDSLKT